MKGLIAILLSFFSLASYSQNDQAYIVQLLSARTLTLCGSASSIDFSCEFTGPSEGFTYVVHPKDQYDADRQCIQIRVDHLDCGGSGINKDLQKSMEADTYPYIEIEPMRTNLKIDAESSSPQKVWVETGLTIAGTRKNQYIHLTAYPLGNGRFQLKGHHTINMSHFGIEAPKPMFGLVKVNDQISLEFDLVIRFDAGTR